MNDRAVKYRRTVNVAILAITILSVSVILGIGHESVPDIDPDLTVGRPSPERFVADRTTSEIPDVDKTESARRTAANSVPSPYNINQATSQGVVDAINAFYADLSDVAFLPLPAVLTTQVPDLVGMRIADAEAGAEASGLLLSIVGSVEPPEEPEEPEEPEDGTIASQVPPPGTTVSEGTNINVVVYVLGTSATTTTTTVSDTTTTTLPRRGVEEQIAMLLRDNVILPESTIAQFVALHEKDIERVAGGELSVFPEMQATSIQWATDELVVGIRSTTDLNEVQQKYLNPTTRPPVSIVGLDEGDLEETREAIASLVARRLQINETIDETQLAFDREAAREAVSQQTTTYRIGDLIADDGQMLTSVQIAAIQELGLYDPEVKTAVPRSALIIVGIISVLITAFLLARITPKNFERPRRVALLAIILILSAGASRIPEFVARSEHGIGYIIPAIAIGVMASILFDHRTALLLAMPVAGFTAVSTGDIAFTVYAGIAAAIPVAFVSSVSTRAQLRLSVLGSAAIAAPVAAGLEFLFTPDHTGAIALQAGAWAFVGAVIGGFIGQGLVSFLESAFGVTTTMSLLDLLDRNHPALQLLEEKAPGTFNHSMLVGSIAGRAARSIDADPLLAQAAAWYHDLGKTEYPQYFVENQLGYNPHDDLTPEESAELIRAHVTAGLELASQYRIPEDVADGIRMHHGTSLMRFFYHKALTANPDADAETYRHHGEKPTRKEMAIVMIADATEAAARAYAQSEQPTEEGLSKLVDTIVSEKLDDGQFDESSLTFGELTTIKREVVAALSAYYHARVDYPNFPKPALQEGS